MDYTEPGLKILELGAKFIVILVIITVVSLIVFYEKRNSNDP